MQVGSVVDRLEGLDGGLFVLAAVHVSGCKESTYNLHLYGWGSQRLADGLDDLCCSDSLGHDPRHGRLEGLHRLDSACLNSFLVLVVLPQAPSQVVA